MYNDYYLQEISNKISTTNSNLNTIITNTQTIITNQETILTNINKMGVLITMIISTILIYKFIERCLR